MDLKKILLVLADTNGDGKLNLSDLPGIIKRAEAVAGEVEELKATLQEFAAADKLTSNGQHVSADQLAQLWADARAELTTLGDKSRASNAAIAAAGETDGETDGGVQ